MFPQKCDNLSRGAATYVLLCLAFRIAMDFLYVNSVVPTYHYVGFDVVYIGHLDNILSYLTLGAIAYLIAIAKRPLSPASFVVNFIYLTTYLPISILYVWGGMDFIPYLYLSIIIIIVVLIVNGPEVPVTRFNSLISINGILLLMIALSVISFAIVIGKYGFRMPTSFTDVYGSRGEYVSSLEEGGSFIAYVLGWQGNVINPILIAIGLTNKRLLPILCAVFLQLMIFAVTGLKSLTFGLLFVVWLLIGVRCFKKNILAYIPGSYLFAVIAAYVIDKTFDTVYFSATLVNRLFMITSQLFYHYFDFISDNVFTYFSQFSVFNNFIRYPYDRPLRYLIGQVYYDRPEAGANVNMWAEGYASAGIMGMFVFAILLVVILKILNSISYGKNTYVVYSAIAIPVFSLTNTNLFTTLVSHGLFLALVCVYVLPPINDIRERTT